MLYEKKPPAIPNQIFELQPVPGATSCEPVKSLNQANDHYILNTIFFG